MRRRPVSWSRQMGRRYAAPKSARTGRLGVLALLRSAFVRRRKEVLESLLNTLTERGIEPIGAEGAPPRSVHTEHRVECPGVSRIRNPAPFEPVEDPTNDPVIPATASPVPSGSNGLETYPAKAPPRAPISNNDGKKAQSVPNHGTSKPAHSGSSTPGRQQIDRSPSGNPVVTGLEAVDERFRNPQCTKCHRVARVNILTKGPVVVCTNRELQ